MNALRVLSYGLALASAVYVSPASAITAAENLTANISCTGTGDGCGSGPWGTVSLSQTATNQVTVTVSLDESKDDENFVNTGYLLLFNLASPFTDPSFSSFTNGAGIFGSAPGMVGTTGTWGFGAVCLVAETCSDHTGFSFIVTETALTTAAFVSNAEGTYLYASDVILDDPGSGYVGDPLSVSATPLPATLPLFAGGLGFVGYLTRRKKRVASELTA
jgi:hypothetical protein